MNQTVATQCKCPGCNHSEMDLFFDVESMPVFCNVLWDTRQEALAALRAPIHLAYCQICGLIYNTAFAPKLMEYSPAYENSLHFSPHFQDYARNLAQKLIQRYQLRNKDIIEIGCGQGDFLSMLQKLGNNRVLGFDPSYNPDKASKITKVKVIQEAYSQAFADYPADLICSRHVLEHIDKPLDFLTSIRNTIGRRNNTVVYFEVPNALFILKNNGIWDIIYEHCSYFTSHSLASLFVRAGFEPIDVTEQYDGQFLAIEARPASKDTDRDTNFDNNLSEDDINDLVKKFQRTYQEQVNLWRSNLLSLEEKQNRLILWGAGSKGVTFLNTLNISSGQIEYIVDLNPAKHGKYIPGTAQQVIAPEFLKQYQPDTVIVMNPVYLPEIRQIMREFNITTDFISL